MVEHSARYARADKLLSKCISLEELQQNRMCLTAGTISRIRQMAANRYRVLWW